MSIYITWETYEKIWSIIEDEAGYHMYNVDFKEYLRTHKICVIYTGGKDIYRVEFESEEKKIEFALKYL